MSTILDILKTVWNAAKKLFQPKVKLPIKITPSVWDQKDRTQDR